MAKKRVLILGAGLSGLSAAWHLKERGVIFEAFEKEPEVGGLCRSEEIGSFIFDYDGHLLHFRDKSIYSFVKELLGGNLACHERKSFVRYKGCEIPYPFQVNFSKLPAPIAWECLDSLKTASNHKENYPNFKDWAYANFGLGITRHFMLPYNEKFWTVPAEKLTYEWAERFIPRFKPGHPKSNPRAIGYNAQFYYPARGGIKELPLALARGMASKIHLNSAITSIDLKNKEVVIKRKEKVKFSELISSLPLPELKNLIPNLPSEIKYSLNCLNYNSLLVFNLGIKGRIAENKHWVYFPEKKFKYFRLGFYSSFSKTLAPANCSSLYVEVSYPKGRAPDKEGLKKEIVASLIKEDIIDSADSIISSSAIDIKYGYPIYDHYYQEAVPKIINFLFQQNIYSIGRYGSWRYLSMEEALLEGKKIAKAI